MKAFLKIIWILFLRMLKGVLFAGLYMSVALVVWTCIEIPYTQSIAIGLSAFAILATFSGLCLRLASAIDNVTDKKHALRCREKSFTTLFLFAIFLSLKVSIDLFGSTISNEIGIVIFTFIKWISYCIILIPMMLILFDGMKDVTNLILVRASAWNNAGIDLNAPR